MRFYKVVGNSVLWTPCCGGWAHRPCVERMALVAGSHHFKCPLCNNKDEFAKEMEEFGIYVPDQDAEWEAGDAFGDQLQRHDRCFFRPKPFRIWILQLGSGVMQRSANVQMG